ncbi:energy-coupling factor transporter transmembrane component T family protein [Bacillus thuringiensis]|uniref:energy-coupling factor transporter transmembrane component T family protein n=1 Tax=Bacillus thuringiensis TaxID=1428 RepID=UPI000BFB344B|nr:energy-coupling factor transporter transmembrane component T [Bacillus thuringiensis]PGP54148.1 cobalamin biosynthesis protein CbiQ [Bacillus thuringiensis]PGY50284.1 cobalamin biosynthesis protein CbiQ [Bacillus thuringiensis]
MHSTYFHRMDGVVKLFLFIFCMTLTFLFFDFRVLLILFIIGCIGLSVAKIPFRKILIVFSVIFTFSLLNSVMILFITPTHGSELTESYTAFLHIGYATITYETLFYAATLSLKYFTLLPFTLLFIYTTDPSEFVSSLSKLGIHYKITYAINIALRYIPDIQSEYKIIKHAQEARGVAFEKGEASLWVRMKNRVLIFWPLIIHSLERIDTVSNAMDLRGFGKKDKRTWFYTSKAKREDFIILFAGVFIFIAAVYLKLNVFQNFWYPF